MAFAADTVISSYGLLNTGDGLQDAGLFTAQTIHSISQLGIP